MRRFELVVAAAIVFSIPSLVQAFDGGIAVSTALLRLAAALALCWAVGAIVERTLDGYARQARQKELEERLEEVRAARAAVFGEEAAAGPAVPAEQSSGTGRPLR